MCFFSKTQSLLKDEYGLLNAPKKCIYIYLLYITYMYIIEDIYNLIES